MDTAHTRTHAEGATSLKERDFSVRSDLAERELPYRFSTGVPQLDEIMQGGYVPQRSYMIRGDPGAGKTTLGLHFLAAGAARK